MAARLLDLPYCQAEMKFGDRPIRSWEVGYEFGMGCLSYGIGA